MWWTFVSVLIVKNIDLAHNKYINLLTDETLGEKNVFLCRIFVNT